MLIALFLSFFFFLRQHCESRKNFGKHVRLSYRYLGPSRTLRAFPGYVERARGLLFISNAPVTGSCLKHQLPNFHLNLACRLQVHKFTKLVVETSASFGKSSLEHSKSSRIIPSNQKLARALTSTLEAIARTMIRHVA